MKRFLILCVGLAFVAAIPLTHSLMAQKPDTKVLVCHVTHVGEVQGVPGFVGKVIEVSLSALPAHCAHGDHNPVIGTKVKGDDCGRKIVGATATCNGETPVNPPWYK